MPEQAKRSSAGAILVSILLMTFLVEGGLMLLFYLAGLDNGLAVALLDALLLPILLAPALYVFAYRPLLQSNRDLQKAINEIRTLEGIIPICAYCKKIRDDEEIWQQIEDYISEHSDAKFSHGMCPDCYEKQLVEVRKLKSST